MRTSNPDIYAIGDITNIILLAHVASQQGIVAADHINGLENKMQYDLIPSAIFTIPEIGHAGLTEKEANVQGSDYITGKFPFMANGKAHAMGEVLGFVKLIANKETRKIVGGTAVGVHAAELLSTISNIIAAGLSIEKALFEKVWFLGMEFFRKSGFFNCGRGKVPLGYFYILLSI